MSNGKVNDKYQMIIRRIMIILEEILNDKSFNSWINKKDLV